MQHVEEYLRISFYFIDQRLITSFLVHYFFSEKTDNYLEINTIDTTDQNKVGDGDEITKLNTQK